MVDINKQYLHRLSPRNAPQHRRLKSSAQRFRLSGGLPLCRVRKVLHKARATTTSELGCVCAHLIQASRTMRPSSSRENGSGRLPSRRSSFFAFNISFFHHLISFSNFSISYLL